MPPSDELRARIRDDHSERLRDLEGHYTEVATRLAAQSVQIDQLGDSVGQLGDRFESGISNLGQKIDDIARPLADKVQQVVERIDEHSNQLADLQKSEKARGLVHRSRRKQIKSLVIGIVIAAVGALSTKIVETAWAHFTPPPAQSVQVQSR
jgi:DNA repair ATPase RecN